MHIKRKISVLLTLVTAAYGIAVAGFDFSSAQTANDARLLDISAYLFNSEDKEVPNGEYDVRFALYTVDREKMDPYPSNADAGNKVWEETQKIKIYDGILAAYLGTATPFPDSVNFEGAVYYLGIRIGQDSETVPRKKIASVPGAVNSQFLRGATTGTKEGNIPIIGKSDQIDIDLLPTGTSGKKLVLANNPWFDDIHTQNTDTGTDSLTFNIGDGSAISGNDFDLIVSSASSSPALRYSGSAVRWQFSNDGTTFSNIPLSSDIHNPATLAGAYGYLTLSDQEITLGQINLTTDVTGILPIASGGTNAATIGSAGSIAYSTGTAYGFSAAGAAGEVLLSGGAGTPVWGTVAGGVITPDSLDFTELADTMTLDANLAISASASNYSINFDSNTLFLDTENNRVGIGTASPNNLIQVKDLINFDNNYNPNTESNTNEHTGLGYQTGLSGSGNYGWGMNTFVGYQAGYSNTPDSGGSGNISMGVQAGYSNIDGQENIFIGNYAGRDNPSSWGNIFIGHYAGSDSDGSSYIGYNNTAMGMNAGKYLTGGAQNVFLGDGTGMDNTTGSYNSAVGAGALSSNLSGSNNTAVGYQAGFGVNSNSFSNNSLFGYRAGLGLSTGSNNILLGYQAGDNLTTGLSNIILGYDIDAPSATGSNQLNIGNAIYGDLSTGNVGIGTASPTEQLEITGNFRLPTSTDTTGIIFSGADRFIHNYGTSNFFAGVNAGNLTMTGTGANTAVGAEALYSNTDGYKNTVLGYQAGYSNTRGDTNVFIGYQAGYSNTTRWEITAVGAQALYHNIAYNNSAFGYRALYYNTTGNYNTATGYDALYSNRTGRQNTATGSYALYSNRTGNRNIATGYEVLSSNTTGSYNTATGSYALYSTEPTSAAITAFADNGAGGTRVTTDIYGVLSESAEIVISGTTNYNGTWTISNVTEDTFDIATAFVADDATGWWGIDAEGRNNTALGYYAGYSNITGSNNLFLGYNAGYGETLADLTNATCIGYECQVTASNSLILGGTGANAVNVGIGTTSPLANLHVQQTATATGALKGIIYTGAVNTNQTASTEIPSLTLTTAGRQWATGALATQREVLITAPTYSFVGASAITDAATLAIAGAPIKSTNAAITNTHGLLIQAGAVGAATNSYGLTVNAQTGATNNYAAAFLGGNVGIGTATPGQQLEITGNFKLPTTTVTTGIIYAGTNRFIHNYGTSNFFAGVNAGNLTMTGTGFNVAVGVNALLYNTSGNSNSVIGYEALLSNTSGNANTAMGFKALYYLTGAYSNNTALGYSAGRYQADGSTPLTSASQSVYIGSGARGYNNSDVNSIVIGYQAAGIGANSVVLGNDSILTTALKGNVGIGTASPTAYLQIKAGTATANTAPLKFTSGTNLTTAETGAIEYDGSELYFTPTGTTRETIAYVSDLVTDHGGLTGLTDDDHSIYALLAGRTGGQTLIGGTVADTTLTIQGNSTTGNTAANANLIFKVGDSGGTTAMTILNSGNVGIGSAAPTSKLYVQSTTDYATLGDEMVTNGSFDGNADGWTLGLGGGNPDWYYNDYKVSHASGGGEASLQPSTPLTVTAGASYLVSFDVYDYSAGYVSVSIGGSGGQSVSYNVSGFSQVIVANSTANLEFTPYDDFVGSIGNVSVKLITAAPASFTLANAGGTNTPVEFRSGGDGSYNTFIGFDSGKYNTTGYANSAVGYQALYSNTTGYANSAMGIDALYSNTTGYDNSAMGALALYSNITGRYNSAMGRSALRYNITGDSNSAMGSGALYYNTTGNYNSAMGLDALGRNRTGSRNTGVGYLAMGDNGNLGDNNTALGYEAGLNLMTTGAGEAENNLFLGYRAGNNIYSGSNNIMIGYDVQGISSSVNNSLNIGNAIYGDLSTGNVGIGTASPTEQLEITGNFRLPTSTDTTGIIFSGADRFIHNYGTSNFFAGVNAGNLTMTGTGANTAVGAEALYSNTDGYKNTVLGYQAGYSNTGGDTNVYIGYQAGYSNTTRYDNTAVGVQALYYNIAEDNSAFGYKALYSNTKGHENTGISHYALRYNTTGNHNTATGYDTLYSNTTGSNNTADGYYALYFTRPTSAAITAFADNGSGGTTVTSAGHGLSESTEIVISGTTNYNGTWTIFNVATDTFDIATTFVADDATGWWGIDAEGRNNTALGYYAGYSNITGSNNLFLGYNAGYTGTSADLTNATCIGYECQVTASNSLILGGTGANAVNVGIGTSTPNVALDVIGSGKFSTGIKDNAGTPLLSIDTGTRKLYASDGTTVGLDYSLAGGISGGGAGTPVSYSNFFGNNAGSSATDASYSNFFGEDAGGDATYASDSNFFGTGAGYGATNANNSNFFGTVAGYGATNANNSNFFGYYAGRDAVSASYSNFFGYDTGKDAVNASYSNFFGEGAGRGAANAKESIFFGTKAGYYDTVDNKTANPTGTSIAIGRYSGTGGFSNSIAIGHGVINSAALQANIGNVLYLTGIYNSDTQSSTPMASGNVGIGTASPVANLHVQQTATATGALKGIIYTGAVNTNQTASTEIPSLTLTTAGREWATGALATQREVLITAPTYSFVGASAITDAATLAIAGAPIKSTNATIANTHGLLIQTGAVGAATNSYGLTVNAQTGATNNYAAAFMGGNVGIGTASPTTKLQVYDDHGSGEYIDARIGGGYGMYLDVSDPNDNLNSSLGINLNSPSNPGAASIVTTSTSQILVGFSTGITNGDMVFLTQYTSDFSGDGLHMNFANGSGSFTGNFLNFNVNNVNKFKIDKDGGAYFAGNVGIGTASFGTNAAGALAITGSTAPTTSITDGIQLFAVDVAGSHELQVRDEAGNVTTLSPHNFSIIPEGPSEDLAWSFYSERQNKAINVDMAKTVRLVEQLTGQQLVYLKDLKKGQYLEENNIETEPLLALEAINDIQTQSANLQAQNDSLILKTNENIDSLEELQDSVDEQFVKISNSSSTLADRQLLISNEISNFQKQIVENEEILKQVSTDVKTLADRQDANDNLIAVLQAQIEELKTLANSELNLAQIGQNKTDIEYLKLVLGLDRAENGSVHLLGNLEADEVVAGVFTIKTKNNQDPLFGKAAIPTGEKNVLIDNKNVKADSLINITLKSDAQNQVLYISRQVDGEFEVSIKESAVENIDFNWWIMQAEY